jgi:hypothetical protein
MIAFARVREFARDRVMAVVRYDDWRMAGSWRR